MSIVRRINEVAQPTAEFELAVKLLQNEGLALAATDYYYNGHKSNPELTNSKQSFSLFAGRVAFGVPRSLVRIEHAAFDILLAEKAAADSPAQSTGEEWEFPPVV